MCVEFPNDAEFLKSDVLQDFDMRQELTVNFQQLKFCTVSFQAQIVNGIITLCCIYIYNYMHCLTVVFHSHLVSQIICIWLFGQYTVFLSLTVLPNSMPVLTTWSLFLVECIEIQL